MKKNPANGTVKCFLYHFQAKEAEADCSKALAVEKDNVKALFRRAQARKVGVLYCCMHSCCHRSKMASLLHMTSVCVRLFNQTMKKKLIHDSAERLNVF